MIWEVSKRFIASMTLALLIQCVGTNAQAEVRLHPLFTDHGVLQQNQDVPVWGTAPPGDQVEVAFAGQSVTATADASGQWMAVLEPLSVDSSGKVMTVRTGECEVQINDLLVGEVWVCSGQSNMAAPVRNSTDYLTVQTELQNESRFETLRLLKVPVAGADERQDSFKASWNLVNDASVSAFSATGFYFGRALHRDRRVPVGLIQSCNGGTNAYSWINSDTLQNDPIAEVTRSYWKAVVANGPKSLERFERQRDEWTKKVREAKAAGKPVQGRAPREPQHRNHVKRPAGHYNAMIAPLQPYAIAGAIWYQGESNSRPPFCSQYRDLMLALVEDWRGDWHSAKGDLTNQPRRNFPFYLVQLPNYANGHEEGWPIIREQMLQFWQQGDQTGMVTTIDVGDPGDIHPRNKMPVGERLALFARANAYGEPIVGSGPIFKSMETKDNQAFVSFEHMGGGMVSLDGKPLRHFQAAGDDMTFHDADAVIENGRLVVSSPGVPAIKHVRYAWTNNPENPNFGNQEQLLASPFRSDQISITLE